MRIAFFTDTYYPQVNGVATSVLILKEYLEQLGHEIYVFTTTDPSAPKSEPGVYRVASIPFTSARRIGAFYHPRLGRLIKRLGLDVIHTHTEFSLGIFGRLMARNLRVPLVHTMHTIYEDYTHYLVKMGSLDPFAKAAARKISVNFCNVAARVVVPSIKMRTLLASYGVTSSISVVPTGVRLEKFSAVCPPEKIAAMRASLGIAPADKVLLNIGRISEEKNIGEILGVMRDYLPSRPDVKLLFVGNGPAHAALEADVAEMGLRDRILFAGERPWDEIGAYYKLGDLFVSASRSESQGLTYIEALASGLPLVARADPCLEGVLAEGVNGYPFEDSDSFVRALDRVLEDDLHRAGLSRNAAASAEKFSAEHFANTMAWLYRFILTRERLKNFIAS